MPPQENDLDGAGGKDMRHESQQLASSSPKSNSSMTVISFILAVFALALAYSYPRWIATNNPVRVVDTVAAVLLSFQNHLFGLGWYLAPITTSLLLVLGGTIPNRAGKGEDHIIRHPNKSSRWPTRAFATLRMLDPILVWWLLQQPNMMPMQMLEGRKLLLVGMVAVGALRHAFWVTYINRNEWNWELAITVGIFNNWFDWTHAKCLLRHLADNNSTSSVTDEIGRLEWVGVIFFVVGGFFETFSEWQRRKFKDDLGNKGKLYRGGLFAYARHINYFGYILWRTGIGLVSGPPFTLSYGLYHATDFYLRAIPMLQNHMQAKYGDQWTEYTKQTKSVFIPGVL